LLKNNFTFSLLVLFKDELFHVTNIVCGSNFDVLIFMDELLIMGKFPSITLIQIISNDQCVRGTSQTKIMAERDFLISTSCGNISIVLCTDSIAIPLDCRNAYFSDFIHKNSNAPRFAITKIEFFDNLIKRRK
jgi:hypothetical protein